MNAKDIITEAQRRWAGSAGIVLDEKQYVPTLDENLYVPLDDQLRLEFRSGGGSELVEGRRTPAKFRAPHSSSALAVNVFAYFRTSDQLALLAELLGVSGEFSLLKFERRRHTGISQPNLDVELSGNCVLGIESKFREPYEKSVGQQHRAAGVAPSQPANEGPFKARYFATPGLWDRLPRCRELAVEMQERHAANDPLFRRLDAAQLLKHALGLAQTVADQPFRLMVLWFEVWEGGTRHPATVEHENELAEFTTRIEDELDFGLLSYQELYRRMVGAPAIAAPFLAYLGGRYFSGDLSGGAT